MIEIFSTIPTAREKAITFFQKSYDNFTYPFLPDADPVKGEDVFVRISASVSKGFRILSDCVYDLVHPFSTYNRIKCRVYTLVVDSTLKIIQKRLKERLINSFVDNLSDANLTELDKEITDFVLKSLVNPPSTPLNTAARLVLGNRLRKTETYKDVRNHIAGYTKSLRLAILSGKTEDIKELLKVLAGPESISKERKKTVLDSPSLPLGEDPATLTKEMILEENFNAYVQNAILGLIANFLYLKMHDWIKNNAINSGFMSGYAHIFGTASWLVILPTPQSIQDVLELSVLGYKTSSKTRMENAKILLERYHKNEEEATEVTSYSLVCEYLSTEGVKQEKVGAELAILSVKKIFNVLIRETQSTIQKVKEPSRDFTNESHPMTRSYFCKIKDYYTERINECALRVINKSVEKLEKKLNEKFLSKASRTDYANALDPLANSLRTHSLLDFFNSIGSFFHSVKEQGIIDFSTEYVIRVAERSIDKFVDKLEKKFDQRFISNEPRTDFVNALDPIANPLKAYSFFDVFHSVSSFFYGVSDVKDLDNDIDRLVEGLVKNIEEKLFSDNSNFLYTSAADFALNFTFNQTQSYLSVPFIARAAIQQTGAQTWLVDELTSKKLKDNPFLSWLHLPSLMRELTEKIPSVTLKETMLDSSNRGGEDRDVISKELAYTMREKVIMEVIDGSLDSILIPYVVKLLGSNKEIPFFNSLQKTSLEIVVRMIVKKIKPTLLKIIEKRLFNKKVSIEDRLDNGKKILARLTDCQEADISPMKIMIKQIAKDRLNQVYAAANAVHQGAREAVALVAEGAKGEFTDICDNIVQTLEAASTKTQEIIEQEQVQITKDLLNLYQIEQDLVIEFNEKSRQLTDSAVQLIEQVTLQKAARVAKKGAIFAGFAYFGWLNQFTKMFQPIFAPELDQDFL